ncbi:MAG TPA: hypothetical protein DEU03_05345 [Bacillus sp. (in: Bacteria)]|nr:hypothetical protein [Bacillus sp. (in: firmicutes)]
MSLGNRGIQKNVETLSFSDGNELKIESIPSKIINVKIDVLLLYVVLAAIISKASVYNKLTLWIYNFG